MCFPSCLGNSVSFSQCLSDRLFLREMKNGNSPCCRFSKSPTSGLEFLGGMAGFAPKIQKSHQKELLGPETSALKSSRFYRNFFCMKRNSCLRKIRRFSCNSGKFFSVRGNFLLTIGSNSFSISQELNEVRIEKSELSRRSVFTLNDR